MDNYLKEQIKRLSDYIYETKTKKKHARVFGKYLDDWALYRLTSKKREKITYLFRKYNLQLFDPETDKKIPLTRVKRNDLVVIKYIEKKAKTKPDKIDNPNNLTVHVAKGVCSKRPYHFQLEAYKKLTEFYKHEDNKGLLILPTGAGKTFTAVYWLLKNIVDKDIKLIWVAHRHELLEQVSNEIQNLSFSNVLPNKDTFSIHLISGSHDKAIRIDKEDDILIASVQTLNRNLDHLEKKFLKNNKKVFLVIDEAHHAPAKTYRNLIKRIEKSCNSYDILGLTATPFRTAEREKSYLSKIFYHKPIYSKDMQDLIIDKTLAEPVFIPVNTDITFNKKDFTVEELNLLQSNFDLPEQIKKKIVARKDRNSLIVKHYLDNQKKYKKTIVFALDQTHAIQLNNLFNYYEIKSDFVISGTENFIGVTTDKEHNKNAIKNFRDGKIDALINVNILTEGTDLPKTQTVFLTRPTKSKTLMTQMVGRALRGEKAGGTKRAYIVSFIDNWGDLVAWQSPSELFVDENDILDSRRDYKKYEVQFISIELINQFTSLADKTVDTEELEAYPAIMRIPLGWYSFELQNQISNDEIDFISCKVLVFEQHKEAFDNLENDIEQLYERFDYDNNGILNNDELNDLLAEIKDKYFDKMEYPEPKINEENILNILKYYDANKRMPVFFTFTERDKYDITKLVKHIISCGLNFEEETEFINKEWEGVNGKSIWKEFYGMNNKRFFLNDINLEKDKIRSPESFKIEEAPKVVFKKEDPENLPLHFWPRDEYLEIREKVFNKWNKEHPDNKIKKKERWKYQIDHIIPMAKGGKTTIDNLQPLLFYENKIKGDKY